MNYQKRLIVTPPGAGRSRLSLGTFGTGPANVPTSAGSRMPSAIKSAGPNITTATLGTPVATGSATVHQPFTVAIGDFVASHNPAWFGGLKYYKRAHGDTHVVQVGKLDPQPSSVTWTNAVDLGTGTTNWDIGLSYIGANGEESTIVWPSNFDNVDPGALMDLGAGSVTWATMKGDTSGDTTTAIADAANKAFTHPAMSVQTQQIIADNAGNGQLNVAPVGGVAGQIGSNVIAGNSIQTSHIQQGAVGGVQVLATAYSTQQLNALVSPAASKWSTAAGSPIDSGTVIANGAAYYWNTGAGSYGGTSPAYQQALTLAANATATFVFQHSVFLSGGAGRPRIFFTGQTGGAASTTQDSTPVSGSSTANITGKGVWNSSFQAYGPPFTYGSSNGSPYTVSVSPNVAVSVSNPLALVLSSVNCPAATDGTSSLTVQLTDSGGTVLHTWTGVTTAQTLSYSTSHAADTFTWSVWAVPVNNNVQADVPYNENMVCTFSGSATYYVSSSSSGQTYVLAVDGVTQRINTSDSNVQMVQLAADTIAVKVTNSNAAQLGFSLGMDVSGV